MDAEELKKLLAEFKKENDKAIEAKMKNGKADPLLEKKVDEINAKLTDGLDKFNARMDAAELKAGRTELDSGAKVLDVAAQAKEFLNRVNMSKKNPTVFEFSVAEYNNYQKAFWNYLRTSPEGVAPEIRNAMIVGADGDGGYQVVPTVSNIIAKKIFDNSPIRSLAAVIPIGSDSVKGPSDVEDIDTGGWTGEGAPRPVTGGGKFGEWEIKVHEQYAQPKVTQQLLSDSVFPVENWLVDKIADKFARNEGDAFVNGDGVQRPRGFLTYGSGNKWGEVEQIKSGENGKLKADAFIDLIYSMKSAYSAGSVLLMERSTIAAARKLKDGQGNHIWLHNFSEAGQGTIMGVPVVEVASMPKLVNGSLSVAFVNLKLAYLIADRPGMTILRDPLTEKGFVKLYTTKRVGGGVINFDAVKLMKASA